MSDNQYQLYCCGSRGSRPVEGKRFNEFGGFTSCFVLKKKDYALIIDCGTGLYEANAIVLDCAKIDVVLTHMHYDHVLGMLDWTAIPSRSNVTFYSSFYQWLGENTFVDFFREPFWPVQPKLILKDTPKDNTPLILNNDLSIVFYPADHPNQSQLMKIMTKDENGAEHSIVVMFDAESSDGIEYNDFNGCDYLLYDGMYTDSEYPKYKGYGHSTWQSGCRLASRINCKKLIVSHHHPNRLDEDLRRFEKLSRDIFPSTDFARSGQSWSFPMLPEEGLTESAPAATAPSKIKDLIQHLNRAINETVLNNDRRIHFLSIGCYSLLGLVSVFMTVVNVYTNKRLLMYSTLVFAVLCAINIILDLKIKIDYKIVQIIFQIEITILCTFFIISGTPEGFSALWVLMLPVAGMLVFGKRNTTIQCAIMMILICFFLHSPSGVSLLQYPYTESFKLRFPMAFIAFYAIGYFLEVIRERTFNELENLRNTQAETIANQTSELREQNFNMLRINSKLELSNRVLRDAVTDKDSIDPELLNEVLKNESK